MKSSVRLLLFPALVAAQHAMIDEYSSPLRYIPSVTTTPTSLPQTAQSVPTSTPEPTSSTLLPHEHERLPHALKQFIIDLTPKSELERRQQAAGGGGGAAGGGIAPGGGVPAAVTPTQVSPVTVYDIGDGVQTYTQLFKHPPDQWSSPAPGTIGLGTISGSAKLGQVKTYKNPAPTNAPEHLMGAMLAGGVGAAMVL